MDVNLLHGKAFGSGTTNLLERHRPLKKMAIALGRHFSEVRANQFVL
jgi:hypothetical protein